MKKWLYKKKNVRINNRGRQKEKWSKDKKGNSEFNGKEGWGRVREETSQEWEEQVYKERSGFT